MKNNDLQNNRKLKIEQHETGGELVRIDDITCLWYCV